MYTIIGFLSPLLLAGLIGLLLHVHGHHQPAATTRPATAATTGVPSGPLPSGSAVSVANAAIVAYCNNDLRQDDHCSLVADSDVTAPGFVKAGIRESGHYATGDDTTDGVAVAKGSGSSWSVIWLGQGCVPKAVADQNQVPASLGVCAS